MNYLGVKKNERRGRTKGSGRLVGNTREEGGMMKGQGNSIKGMCWHSKSVI